MSAPLFRYSIPGYPGFLDSRSPLWDMPLSGNSEDHGNDKSDRFLIKHFFESAKIFLVRSQYEILDKGLKFYGKDNIEWSDIHCIDISLEKHGAFYHPARVSVLLKNEKKFFFVLNMAVSHAGLNIIKNEYRVLSRLNTDHPNSVLPEVFAMGIVPVKQGEIAFFLAQWFEGFHEFHVTPSSTGTQIEKEQIGLWETDGTVSRISSPGYFIVYEKAAEILTDFYNIKTFEQIFPWHHAAGDFVIKKTGHEFDVRLITVRGYGPLLEIDSDLENMDTADLLQALLVFFMNLSLRMRIDRINGTGDYHFMDTGIISAVLKGFFRAVSNKYLPGIPEKNTGEIFLEYIKTFNVEDIYEIIAMIADSYNRNAPEIALIQKNLKNHSQILFNEINRL